MSIVIFGDLFSFPEGTAATNRVHTYAKGLHENGIEVHVICFANEYLKINDGITNGISFYHPYGQRERSKYFLVRRWQKLKKYFKTAILINIINRNDKIIAINGWVTLMPQIFIFILSKFLRSKLILEKSEHPLRKFQGSFLNKVGGNIKAYLQLALCDGIFCISKYLIHFYEKRGMSNKRLFLVPSTVDPSRFSQQTQKLVSYPYIGYFGGLTFERDNIDQLIYAYSKISDTYPDLRLVLGGFCSEKEKGKLRDLIIQLNISNKVELLEYLKRDEIINYIINADILVMVRANNLASKASYPSKLTEFLATANPTISVDVGEISDYLIDGVNAFLVKPGDADALAQKLIYVIDNFNFAQQVGLKGKELTNTIFNYNYQAKRMIDFIYSLN